VKTALILAPTAASFQRVAGMPLIQRVVLAALRSDFDRIVIVGRDYTRQLRALLRSDARTRAVEVAPDVPTVEGTQVTVIPSDRLLTTATLDRVNAVALDGRPLLFGSAGAAGVALCRPALLAEIDATALTNGGAEQLWAALRRRGAEEMGLDGEVCVRVTDARSAAAAERALCARLRRDSAASDGPLAHWIDRHLSLRLSRWLVQRTRLRPNQITLIGTSVGLLGAALLGVGTYWAGVAGTLLFLSATIIDGCDGEIARLTFRETPFGEKLDVITDNIVHVAVFIGLTCGLYRQNPQGHYLLLVAILLIGFGCAGALTYYFLVQHPEFLADGRPRTSWKGQLRHWLLRAMHALMNRDFAYLLLVLALIDRLYWFVWGAAFGTYVFAIALVWGYRWRDAT
jgi:1L-myo-inositol 1-phosphate cytidylyltransferase / CDP-L-myo-inositol myo-inositolphosphotransferase